MYIFIMEKRGPDPRHSTDDLWKQAKWKEPATKGCFLYDPIYMKCLK